MRRKSRKEKKAIQREDYVKASYYTAKHYERLAKFALKRARLHLPTDFS